MVVRNNYQSSINHQSPLIIINQYQSTPIITNHHQSSSINTNQHQSPLIIINQYQSPLIIINQHQSTPIITNQHQPSPINSNHHQSAPLISRPHLTSQKVEIGFSGFQSSMMSTWCRQRRALMASCATSGMVCWCTKDTSPLMSSKVLF